MRAKSDSVDPAQLPKMFKSWLKNELHFNFEKEK